MSACPMPSTLMRSILEWAETVDDLAAAAALVAVGQVILEQAVGPSRARAMLNAITVECNSQCEVQ